MGPAQALGGGAHPTFSHGRANFGRRKGHFARSHRAHLLEAKVKNLSKLKELRKIALAVASEAVVVAHNQVLHSEVAHEVTPYELQRRSLRKLGCKRVLDQRVQAGGRQPFGALFGQGEPRQHKFRMNQLARMRLQRQQDRRSPAFPRGRHRPFDQGLMAAVHPVKGAQGHHGGSLGHKIRKLAINMHGLGVRAKIFPNFAL